MKDTKPMHPLQSVILEGIEAVQYLLAGEAGGAAQREARDWVSKAGAHIPKPDRQLYGCPECGCTDVQAQAWVHANTEEALDEAGSYNWCPQCEWNTGDGETKRLDEVDEVKPFRRTIFRCNDCGQEVIQEALGQVCVTCRRGIIEAEEAPA